MHVERELFPVFSEQYINVDFALLDHLLLENSLLYMIFTLLQPITDHKIYLRLWLINLNTNTSRFFDEKLYCLSNSKIIDAKFISVHRRIWRDNSNLISHVLHTCFACESHVGFMYSHVKQFHTFQFHMSNLVYGIFIQAEKWVYSSEDAQH